MVYAQLTVRLGLQDAEIFREVEMKTDHIISAKRLDLEIVKKREPTE